MTGFSKEYFLRYFEEAIAKNKKTTGWPPKDWNLEYSNFKALLSNIENGLIKDNGKLKTIENMISSFDKIEKDLNKKRKFWRDIFKTKIQRIIKKVPVFIVKNPNFVRLAEYKSDIYEEFENSFRSAFGAYVMMLDNLDLTCNFMDDEGYIEFCELHFPLTKVIEVEK